MRQHPPLKRLLHADQAIAKQRQAEIEISRVFSELVILRGAVGKGLLRMSASAVYQWEQSRGLRKYG